jgi:hypothetical protein
MRKLGPYLTQFAEFSSDRFCGGWSCGTPFHGFFLLFSGFFDRTANPVVMVDDSNDVFSRKEEPSGGHMEMRP